MRFRGFVHPARSFPHSIVSGGAAQIRAEVALNGRSRDVRFLIDTGTDATVLHPTDAQRILGVDLYTIDFDRDPFRAVGLGVGGSVDRVVRDATLTLCSEDRRFYPIEMPILIARPTANPLSLTEKARTGGAPVTTQRSTIAAEPEPAPEDLDQDILFAEQGHRNLEYLVEILDDLEREHPRRLVMVYGDRQVLIGDDSREMEQSLTEEEQRTVAFLPIGPWTEYTVC